MLARILGGRSPEFMLYALFVTTVACALLLCALPRALVPEQTPGLILDRSQVAAVVAADQRAEPPKLAAALELDRRFLEFGDAEDRSEAVHAAKLRRQTLARSYHKLVSEHGEPAALALRSRAVERLEAALQLQLPAAETKRVLGVFPEAIARHQATRDGREVAPHFVMRTLYKARWNLVMGIAADHAFAPIERRAYHGWLALHAKNLGPVLRIQALQQYGKAGGQHVAEAQAVLAFLTKDYQQAVSALTSAYRETSSLRVRNWLRGAQVAAQADPPGP